RRAAAFGMVGAAWGIGFILGPAVGGVVGAFGVRLPFWAAAVFSLVSATYAVFVLPESLARENRGRFSLRRANPVGSLGLLRSHWFRPAGVAESHDAPGPSVGAGAVARRQRQHRGTDGRHRSDPVHTDLRLVHQCERPRDHSGDAVLRRCGPHARIGGPRGPNNAGCCGGGGFRRTPRCGRRQLDDNPRSVAAACFAPLGGFGVTTQLRPLSCAADSRTAGPEIWSRSGGCPDRSSASATATGDARAVSTHRRRTAGVAACTRGSSTRAPTGT